MLKRLGKKNPLDKLLEIDGIGKETLADIKRTYESLDKLIDDLREDKVPLRNDIVELLKKELIR